MTKAKIRAAIAEFCGWTIEDTGNGKLWHLNGISSEDAPPLYYDDLNAIHEAEKQLFKTPQLKSKYLQEILKFQRGGMSILHQIYLPVICASAEQRAEAFVRAINKWEDDN